MHRSARNLSDLVCLLVFKEMKVRYKNSVMGYLWTLLNPFAFALVYFIAFKVIMRVQMPNYSLFLLAGMFPWIWLTNAIMKATGSLRGNSSLIKKVSLPCAILPFSNVVHEMVHFCFALPILFAFIWFAGGAEKFYMSWFWQLPLMMAVQLIVLYPVAYIASILNVFMSDVEYLIGIALSLLFFLTPIVYPLNMVPEKYHIYFVYSPLSALINNWRDILLSGQFHALPFLYCLGVALLLAGLAYVCHKKLAYKVAELL